MSADNVQPVRDPLKTVATTLATAAEAMRDGASDAAARVQQVLPATGRFVSRFVYSSCYFASYGIVFPTMLLANYIPGGTPIATGLLDGANAANDLIRDMQVKAAERKAARAEAAAAADEVESIVDEGVEALDNV